uniref:ATP synthase complex subunit 8 n=1 Tax=Astroblepus sp. NM-2010 TaxID=909838 RepID=F7UJ80_9TELE|nr:ATPase subunit 8 [Astroblepus sp. NM-2010]
MPQLNPNPWFAILVFSWMVFLLMIPHKVLNHTFTNEPTPTNLSPIKLETWNWPWH